MKTRNQIVQVGDQTSTLSTRQYPPKSPLIRRTGRRAFTLVELIIVITILAILATIAFISFQGYASKSRDANRLSSVKNAEIGLEVFQTKSGVYPIQSTGAEISVGTGNVITRQGDFDLSIARVINMNEVPRDPKTQAMYNYISDTEGKGYKVLYYLENTPEYAFFGQTFADDGQTPVVKGQGPGVVLDSADEMVSEDTDLFGAESGSTFTVLVGEGIEIPGTGLELGGGFENFAKKGGNLDAPKTCPDGFIPVPGNAEFLQPGFCVAKYEMGYENALPNTTGHLPDRNTVKYSTIKIPVSKPGVYPIADITQTQSITSCDSIGTHLITNNEWMTIARNIEANGENWTSGLVGSGKIFQGLAESNNTITSPACKTINSTGSGGRLYISRALLTDTKKWGKNKGDDCDSKRQMLLSNGEVIWDLAGNAREHVNKANTLNGAYHAHGKWKIDDVASHWNIAYHATSNRYSRNIIGWSSSGITQIERERFGPSNSRYTTDNGIGNIHGWYWNDNVYPTNAFFRGGAAGASGAGIYTLMLARTASSTYGFNSFRCAY